MNSDKTIEQQINASKFFFKKFLESSDNIEKHYYLNAAIAFTRSVYHLLDKYYAGNPRWAEEKSKMESKTWHHELRDARNTLLKEGVKGYKVILHPVPKKIETGKIKVEFKYEFAADDYIKVAMKNLATNEEIELQSDVITYLIKLHDDGMDLRHVIEFCLDEYQEIHTALQRKV